MIEKRQVFSDSSSIKTHSKNIRALTKIWWTDVVRPRLFPEILSDQFTNVLLLKFSQSSKTFECLNIIDTFLECLGKIKTKKLVWFEA